jgi:hypothetical protein
MDIDRAVIDRAAENIRRMMETYQREIAEAFWRADDELKVGLSVAFAPKGEGIKIKTEINFIAERCKDKSEDEIYPKSPIDLAIERARTETEASRLRAGNTEGTWIRLRGYSHR